MRIKTFLLVAAFAAICALPVAALAKSSTKKKKTKTVYYLALGDSLAQGVQPDATGKSVETKQGYADLLFKAEKKKIKGLKLEKLGCPGESTATMINGGICHYAAGNQLKAALNFIKKHKIAFITIDIGANDIDKCATSTGLDLVCVGQGVQAIQTNLPKIASALRKAGKKLKIAGMTYYDPFLATYLSGPSGQSEAQQSQALSKQVNGDISSAYKAQQIKVADVAVAFHTYDPFSETTTYNGHTVPVAVAKVCQLTWMCAASPKGPNIHANPAGYVLIKTTFKPQI